MKKIICSILLIASVCLCGCSREMPEKTPTQATSPDKIELKDKIFDNVYAGTVLEITDTEITIRMDDRVNETFTLNDRAKEDIRDFKVEKDSRIVVKFVSPEDRTITAIEVIKVE